MKSLLEFFWITSLISFTSKHTFVGRTLKAYLNIKVIPKHSFSLPELILHSPHKLPPNEEVEDGNVNYVNDENSSVLDVLNIEALNNKLEN